MIPEPGEGWVRLSPRKLLLDPVKTLGQAIVPVVVALVGVSRSDTAYWPFVLPLVVLGPIVFGALPWLTTHYRLTDAQVQVRGGVLNKHTSTAPIDRVRSVDLEASLLHRVLGLQKVEIGTGVDADRITLDALARADAHALRTTLLRRREVAPPPVGETPASGELAPDAPSAPVAAAAPPVLLARIDWSWLRFAPFSLGRLVLVAGALGAFSQLADDLPIWNEDTATSAWHWIAQFAVVTIAAVLAVGALLAWVVISVAGYVVQWWRFLLVREHGSLHLTSGLITTRSITVEEAKVRGVELVEPVLMRVVGGAQLATLATGVEDGVTQVLPPCPRTVATGVGGAVLESDAPLTRPLVPHGPRARRRAWLRRAYAAVVVTAAAGVGAWYADVAWEWVALLGVVLGGAALSAGEASYRHLGHALTERHLVVGPPRVARARTALETDGIIGWVLAQSWWQRRIGLVDLVATTAAGRERVLVRDVRLEVAVALAESATPGLLADFLEPAAG